jgi:DNA polymerase-1
VVVQRSIFPTVDLNDPSKRLINTSGDFERLMSFMQTRKALVFDYETSGLTWYRQAEAVGVGLGSWDDQGRFWAGYVPWGHRTGEPQLDREVVVPALLQLLKSPDVLKLAHNIKFEDHFTRKLGGVVGGPRYDTMIAARLFDENRGMDLEGRAAIDLKDPNAHVQKRAVDLEVSRLAKANRMKKRAYLERYGYSEISIYRAAYYGSTDVHHCGGLYSFYEDWGLSSRFPRIWLTEMDLTEVLCDMEQVGLPVDVEYLNNLREILARELEKLEAQLSTMVGFKFEPSKDDQVLWLLKTLGVKITKQTKGGAEALDAEVLQAVTHLHPAIQLILDWREAEKLRNTYTSSILEKLDDNHVVHGDLQQVGTNTGRLSCKTPNYHNMPSESEKRAVAATGKKLEEGGLDPWSIRRAFVVRKDGVRVIPRLFLDYSQIELRVLAWYSQDPVMMQAFLNGEDIHERTAIEVFGHHDKATRRKAKVINFGLSYCLTDIGFSRQANIPLEDAKKFLSKFFQKFAGVESFRKRFWAQIRSTPDYSFTNTFGRPRRLPNIVHEEGWIRRRAERQGIGTLIQGTAAELNKESLVRISKWLKQEQLPAAIVNNVHDDIQLDSDESCLTYVALGCRMHMEDYPEFQPMPIVADCEYSYTNWAEKKKWS